MKIGMTVSSLLLSAFMVLSASPATALGFSFTRDNSASEKEALFHASDAGAEAVEQYRKSAKRLVFIESLDPVKDIIYSIPSGDVWRVGKNIYRGVYRLMYMGNNWANISVKFTSKSGDEEEISFFEWSAENKTEYDEYVFPLVDNCFISCETSAENQYDTVWLLKLDE